MCKNAEEHHLILIGKTITKKLTITRKIFLKKLEMEKMLWYNVFVISWLSADLKTSY